eukprot:scaffold153002_cov44-Prasinocladus_malaysianus.AAC.1
MNVNVAETTSPVVAGVVGVGVKLPAVAAGVAGMAVGLTVDASVGAGVGEEVGVGAGDLVTESPMATEITVGVGAGVEDWVWVGVAVGVDVAGSAALSGVDWVVGVEKGVC